MSRIPYAWGRVVRACTALTPLEKLLWTEDAGLCLTVEGSYLGEGMAERLGTTAEVVKTTRSRLKALGLYHTVPRPGARQALGWYPDLPPQCQPGARPSPREVGLLAVELAALIRERRGRPSTPAHGTVNAGQRSQAVARPEARRGEGVGGGAPPTSERCDSILPTPSDIRTSALSPEEMGGVARATTTEAGSEHIAAILRRMGR